MKIIHRLNKRAEKKEGEGSFLLTDRNGSFLSLGSTTNITHMQGWFNFEDWKMYKSIENLYLEKNITEVENFFEGVVRRYGNSEEEFRLTSTALIYEVRNYDGFINLDLDFREMFDFDDKDRIYDIKKKDDLLIIHYLKGNHWLAIKGVQEYEAVDKWVYKSYPYDEKRGERPGLHVYKAARIKCTGK